KAGHQSISGSVLLAKDRVWRYTDDLCPVKEKKTSCVMVCTPYRPAIMTFGLSKDSMPLTCSDTGFGRQAGF
ncbi:MAG TPA: hypothetical protein VGA86_01575, partial [Desulfatiglandales bacterium]